MNPYHIRLTEAGTISTRIREDVGTVMIVGSVAYNPQAVTPASDLDEVAIADFTQVDWQEFERNLGQPINPTCVKYARSGAINSFSVVWDTEHFEVGLHMWDLSAIRNVVNPKVHNHVFRPDNFDRGFSSTADEETLFNLRGEKRSFYKNPQQVEGGTILDFYPLVEADGDIYVGIQLNNLLLDPCFLFYHGEAESLLNSWSVSLRTRLIATYGTSSEEVNLVNSLDPRLRAKLGPELERRLKTFF